MDSKAKFVIIFSVIWMLLAAGLFVAAMLEWLDKETFKVIFAGGFIVFSLVVFILSWVKKK